ncbi:MAG: hypothetical protein V4723_18270 [Pseudomonadota bacterium]
MLGPIRTAPGTFNADGMASSQLQALNAVGAVGDAQYVQLADAKLAVYDKTSGAMLLGPLPTAALFDTAQTSAPQQPCADAGGNASVQFDHLAKRWIVTRLVSRQDRAGSIVSAHCIAVSAGADAGGIYRLFVLPISQREGQALLADDARLSVWPDAYYLTMALFDSVGNYRGPRVCGIDRPALLSGRDAPVRCRDLGPEFGPVSAATLDGYAIAPDDNSANTLLSLDLAADGMGRQLFVWRFSFSRNTFSEAQAIAVAPFAGACAHALDGACIAQPAPGAPLAALGDRLMPRLAYRNDDGIESLVATHAVQAGAQVGVRWYELRPVNGVMQLHQQGTHAPDHNSRWMGSTATDKLGNIALGYNVAGTDAALAIRYTGRQRSDPHGRMQGEAFLMNGTGVQTGPAGRPALHGAMTLDPIDGCTFWYTQQYGAVTGKAGWHTRIASFRFENCR